MDNVYKKQLIELAIKEKKLLGFDYVSEKMEITSRLVEPIGINNWNLVAKDLGVKPGTKQFQFDGIQELKILKEKHVDIV